MYLVETAVQAWIFIHIFYPGTVIGQRTDNIREFIVIGICCTTVAQAPLTWMLETDPRRGQIWVCESCARQNLRAIESKLDQAWW